MNRSPLRRMLAAHDRVKKRQVVHHLLKFMTKGDAKSHALAVISQKGQKSSVGPFGYPNWEYSVPKLPSNMTATTHCYYQKDDYLLLNCTVRPEGPFPILFHAQFGEMRGRF